MHLPSGLKGLKNLSCFILDQFELQQLFVMKWCNWWGRAEGKSLQPLYTWWKAAQSNLKVLVRQIWCQKYSYIKDSAVSCWRVAQTWSPECKPQHLSETTVMVTTWMSPTLYFRQLHGPALKGALKPQSTKQRLFTGINSSHKSSWEHGFIILLPKWLPCSFSLSCLHREFNPSPRHWFTQQSWAVQGSAWHKAALTSAELGWNYDGRKTESNTTLLST